MNQGTIVIAGRTFPVRELRLGRDSKSGRGAVIIEFDIEGPLPAFTGPVTLYGGDGAGIVQGQEFRMAAIPADITIRVSYSLAVDFVSSAGEVFTFALP